MHNLAMSTLELETTCKFAGFSAGILSSPAYQSADLDAGLRVRELDERNFGSENLGDVRETRAHRVLCDTIQNYPAGEAKCPAKADSVQKIKVDKGRRCCPVRERKIVHLTEWF